MRHFVVLSKEGDVTYMNMFSVMGEARGTMTAYTYTALGERGEIKGFSCEVHLDDGDSCVKLGSYSRFDDFLTPSFTGNI